MKWITLYFIYAEEGDKLKMRKIVKWFGTAAVLIGMLAVVLFIPVSAQATSTGNDNAAKRYNIMLVIDGSGSLISSSKTDPNGMRYELIDDLLGILEDDGHNIGAIVFSGNNSSSTSDAAMEQGIMLNTGMLSLDKVAPNGSLPKDYIAEKIRNTGVDRTFNGKTDIGTAILVAERELQKAQAENGLESLVFLFTDGRTDIAYPSVLAKSEENLNAATLEMSQNGIRLFGAFLNKNGGLDASQISGIVCAANSISINSEQFQESYVEINDAASCHAAVNTLLKFLGYVDSRPAVPVTGSIEDSFTIPGIGVEEINIRLYSYNGEDLPDMEVEITQPDGTVLSGIPLNALCRSSRTVRVYKLEDPMCGTWKLKVTVPKDNTVAYVYAPVVSLLIDAEMHITPEYLHVNREAAFAGALFQKGNEITDPLAYREYTCNLVIKDLLDDSVKTYEIPENNGAFVQELLLDQYGTFEAQIVFSCDMVNVSSDVQTIKLGNSRPTANRQQLKLRSGLFQDKVTELNLLDYVDDLEDGKNLTIALRKGDFDPEAVSLSEGNLQIVNSRIGRTVLCFDVTDTQGAGTMLEIRITCRNMTVLFILAFIALIILIAALVYFVSVKWNKLKPEGDLSATVTLKFDGVDKAIILALPMPGRDAPSKTNLWELARRALKEDDDRIDSGITCGDVKKQLSQFNSVLEKITFSKTVVRTGGKRQGGICVKQGKKKVVMPTKRSAEFDNGGFPVSLDYQLPEPDDFFDDDLDFGTERKSPKKEKKKRNENRADFGDELF